MTAGPEAAASALKRAMGMGADHGIHILTEEIIDDPSATASLIAEYAKKKEYDLILTGVMSEDLMQGQVGPMIAELLFLPCATSVIDARLLPEEGRVKVEREIEGGEREVLELKLPALLSVQSGINDPRYPALSHLLRAARKGAETISAESLSSQVFRQSVVNMVIPPKDRQGLIIEGSAGEKAKSLEKIFREKGFIRTGD
ncbi:electron transfer flavoprotein subunit beta/FixA family protein [Desulfobacterales bacterium HSG16]|nr:electron transfer flavoprotein subunit beta/FixA family protein [Desulfobacterales bacterium HSG16]